MKAGIVKFSDLQASRELYLDANYWLDRTHDVDEDIARTQRRLHQAGVRLRGLQARREAILTEAEPKVERLFPKEGI